jgi:hypothetical protein
MEIVKRPVLRAVTVAMRVIPTTTESELGNEENAREVLIADALEIAVALPQDGASFFGKGSVLVPVPPHVSLTLTSSLMKLLSF